MGRRQGAAPASDGETTASDDALELKRSPTGSRPTRVYVGRVPSSLCLHEPGIRQLFEPFGTVSDITVHHDALSMGADGFLFLEYTDATAAHAAVAAVTQAEQAGDATRFEGMCAQIAVARGASAFRADPAVVDLLLGRRPVSGAFSQHSSGFPLSQHDHVDEDELFLQSLSQRTTRRSSQSAAAESRSRKRKKRSRSSRDDDDE